jgi:hypothetical protein
MTRTSKPVGHPPSDRQIKSILLHLTLVPLPPYLPELNPVERLWLSVRERFLSLLRLFPDDTAILDACCRACNALTAEPARIASLSAPILGSERSLHRFAGIIGANLVAHHQLGHRRLLPSASRAIVAAGEHVPLGRVHQGCQVRDLRPSLRPGATARRGWRTSIRSG